MPKPSIFNPAGMLRSSNRSSDVENIYHALIQAYCGSGPTMGPLATFDMTPGGHFEATVYAKARSLARARSAVERAGNQRNPLKARDLLPSLEKDYGAVPSQTTNLGQRRANVAAKRLLPNGGMPWNIAAQLRAELGAAFLGYYPAHALGDTTVEPASPETSAQVNTTTVVPKWLQILDPVVQTGIPWAVAYGMLDPSLSLTPALVGDVVMVQGESSLLAERVTISSVGAETVYGVTYPTLTATFANAHDIGASVSTANWPVQWSAARTALIVVSAPTVYNVAIRAQVHAIMTAVAREVDQWAIVEGAAGTFPTIAVPATTATFVLDSAPLTAYTVTPSY